MKGIYWPDDAVIVAVEERNVILEHRPLSLATTPATRINCALPNEDFSILTIPRTRSQQASSRTRAAFGARDQWAHGHHLAAAPETSALLWSLTLFKR